MWEICKSADDAAIEFDRTMKFVEATITALRDMDRQVSYNIIEYQSVGQVYYH